MTDEEIGLYFSSIIPMLEKIAAGIAFNYNKTYIHPHVAINEAYLYIFSASVRPLIINPDRLQRITINYIKMMTIWDTTSFDKLEKMRSNDFIIDATDTFDENIESKIEIELWYNDRKAMLTMYRQQETNKIKQIIFDCYFNKGLIKGTALAKHLKINKDYSCKYIREMKHDIREFYKNNK